MANQQKQQADHVRELIAQQADARNTGKQTAMPSAQEIDKMVSDRQQTTDELARLTQQMRNTARELAPTQPVASGRVRSALDGMDENDLNNRMQRSSDWLRSGDFSDAVESRITTDIQKLGQELRDAAHSVGAAQPSNTETGLNRAMDSLSKLRDQLAGLGGRQPGQQGQQGQGQQGQGQQAQLQPNQLSRNGQSGQGGKNGQGQGQQGQQGQGQQGQGGQGGQQGQGGQGGQGQRAGGQRGGGGGNQNGDQAPNPMGNPAGGAGNNRGGAAYNNLDTGNTRIQGQAVAPYNGPTPGDTQREIEQGVNLLNQVRAAVQDSPEARQQVQALIEQMRNLDPSRFPGNPALVEQMHQQLVSQVDSLELQLRKQLDEAKGGTIRNTDPSKVPPGYKDSVAEYYRKLSGGGKQ